MKTSQKPIASEMSLAQVRLYVMKAPCVQEGYMHVVADLSMILCLDPLWYL